VSDLIENTISRIERFSIKNYDGVTGAGEKLVAFSPAIEAAGSGLKGFLMENLYQHYRVARMTIKAGAVIRDLFRIYTEHPDTLPEDHQKKCSRDGVILTATDYIAGMTDRFAIQEHHKLFDPATRG
jgi:dGTPase